MRGFWFFQNWNKEWIKLRYLFLALSFINVLFFLYLYASSAESFSNIEPETMRWYQALHLGVSYFDAIRFLPLLFGLVLAFVQMSQEMRDKRLRITLHFPVEQNRMILTLLSSGLVLLVGLLIPYLLFIPLALGSFYPREAWMLALENGFVWSLGGIAAYLAAATLIMEPFWKRRFVLGTAFGGWIVLFFVNPNPGAYAEITPWLLFSLPVPVLLALYSLYRFKHGNADPLKEREIVPCLGYGLTWLMGILVLSIYIPVFVESLMGSEQGRSYIFYSPLSKNFVYQDSHGGHDFTYGDSEGNVFDRAEYERRLPFVYWKNLAIQKKLPITIDGEEFGRARIRASRQSFSLSPNLFAQNVIEPGLYPLLNPERKVGKIPFPETMFRITDSGMTFLDGDGLIEDKATGELFTKALTDAGFALPSTLIAGKSTNLKPFDEGYFIRDSENKLFHVRQIDSKPFINRVDLPENLEIKHLLISENRKKTFYGLLLDQEDRLYLLSYDKYKLVKLPTPNYEPLAMELQLYSDPLYSILRYGHSEKMYAVALDRNFREIARYEREVPTVRAHIIGDILHWLTPFSIALDSAESSDYVRLSFEHHGLYYLLVMCLGIGLYVYYLKQKGESWETRRIPIALIVLFGLYGFLLLFLLRRDN